jgi:multiple sugar transport system permease protein
MTVAAVRPRRRRIPWPVWVFLLVPAAVEAGWVFWPALNSFYLSLTKWNGLGPPRSVGLRNFTDLLSDTVFLTALRNNVIWAVGFGGLSVLGGLALAVALNRPRRGVGLYRSAIYLPMVFSLAVTGLFWRVLYQPDGAVNGALRGIGLGGLARQWLADPHTALYAVLVAAVWRQVGYVMVLYLAGLKAVDPALYEAAKVDGASAWQRTRYVTIPQLKGVNSVVLSVIVIDSLRSFDIVWSMTRGGPYHSSELLSTYMYSTAFQSTQLGYASAIAVVIFLLALAVILGYLIRAFREET